MVRIYQLDRGIQAVLPHMIKARYRRIILVGSTAVYDGGSGAIDTPNIRFFLITDFEDLCAKKNIRVHQRITLDTEGGKAIAGNANADADLATFVISR